MRESKSRMGSKKLQVWLPLLFSVTMVFGMIVGFKLRENTAMTSFFKVANRNTFQEVLDLISLKYVDAVGTDTLGNKTIQSLLHNLDPHSVYIPATDLTLVNDDLRGNFSGIGVEFQLFHDTVNVLNVLAGGPSEKAGLLVGDKMIKVNDTIQVAGNGLKSEDIRKLLRGSKGSSVKLSVLRDTKLIPVTIERGTISVPSVDAAFMMDSETAFIHIAKFSQSTYREFMMAMERLRGENMKKLVLDLRGNGGGLLGEAVNIADEFLDENKLITYTEGSHVAKFEYRCKRDGLFEKGQLVVLVDEGSASASEVLSGALQDWDRATIVGRRTFGKGLVQEQFGLSDGSALRLTVARYFTPLGRNIQKSYKDGYDKYEEEVTSRFQNGEVLKGDTTKKSGTTYKTPKGRIVYGGGGITPDVYVPFDTTSMGKETVRLYMKGTLSNFIYTYYIQRKQNFGSYKKANELADAFQANEMEWEALKVFAARDTIDLNKVNAKDKADILRRIPGLIARQMWRQNGYFQVMNRTDDFVKKAREVLR